MLKEQAERFIEEVDEFKYLCMGQLGKEMLDSMDDTTLELYRRMFQILRASEDLVLEEAKTLDKLNTKLDALLAVVSKNEGN